MTVLRYVAVFFVTCLSLSATAYAQSYEFWERKDGLTELMNEEPDGTEKSVGFGALGAIDTEALTKLLSTRLKNAQARALRDLFEDAEHGDLRPIADLFSSVAALVVSDGSTVAKGEGLYQAIVRVGLAATLGTILQPEGATCALGVPTEGLSKTEFVGRMNLAYEALAQSRLSAQFGMPKALATIPTGCRDTANGIADLVDLLLTGKSVDEKLMTTLFGKEMTPEERFLFKTAATFLRALHNKDVSQQAALELTQMAAVLVTQQVRGLPVVRDGVARKLALSILKAVPTTLVLVVADTAFSNSKFLAVDGAALASVLTREYATFSAEGYYLRAHIGAGYTVFEGSNEPLEPIFYEELGLGYHWRASHEILHGPHLMASGLLLRLTGPQSLQDTVRVGGGWSMTIYELVDVSFSAGVQYDYVEEKAGAFGVLGVHIPLPEYLQAIAGAVN